MMKTRLLIFDLDGTLIDSRRDISHAVNHMRTELGLAPLPLDTVASYIGDGMFKLVERALQGHNTPIKDAATILYTYYKENLYEHTTLYPDVNDGLRALHAAGYRLAIMSNKPGEACRLILDHFGITPLMTHIVGGDDTDERKPSPVPLQWIMNEVQAPPEATWMIGDHIVDLKAAHAAGTRSIFVTYGMGEHEDAPTDLCCDSFREVASHLLDNAS